MNHGLQRSLFRFNQNSWNPNRRNDSPSSGPELGQASASSRYSPFRLTHVFHESGRRLVLVTREAAHGITRLETFSIPPRMAVSATRAALSAAVEAWPVAAPRIHLHLDWVTKFPELLKPRKVVVKHLGLMVIVSVSLYSLVAMANHSSFADSSRDSLDWDGNEPSTATVKRVESELTQLERYLDGLRTGGTAYASIDNYMTVDDVELLIKDVRGDLSKLEALQSDSSEKVQREIDAKMVDIRSTLARLARPAPAPLDPTKPLVVVSRE